MKKLTKAQQEEQNNLAVTLIEKNTPLLFDIESAVTEGKRFKAELYELKRSNDAIIQTQRERCLKDFQTLQTFLGEYKDIVEMYSEENTINQQHFGFVIGKGLIANSIIFSYYFGRNWWKDSDSLILVNGVKHQVLHPDDVEVWCDKVGEEECYSSLESVFNDNDYTSQIELLLAEYIGNL